MVLSDDQKREDEHCYKEGEVKGGEDQEIFSALAGIMLHVFAEGDKACEGGDDRSAAADVNAEQKLAVIIRELREQYRGGNVTHKLAGKRADHERALIEEHRK